MAVADEERISEAPWDGSPGRFSDSQYESSCALDRKVCGDDWASKPPKSRCSLPYKEPNGEISRAGTHAAAARIGSITNACTQSIASAKAKLRAAYKSLGEDAPDSIKSNSKRDETVDDGASLGDLAEKFGVDPGVPRAGVESLRGIIPFKFRAAGDKESDAGFLGVMEGHFAVFNRWTEIDSFWEGRFMEQIAPGAFKKTMQENRSGMRCLFQHGRDPQIGSKPLGPIRELDEDDTGARYGVPLFDSAYVRELLPALQHDQLGASFRFQVMREEVNAEPKRSDHNPDGIEERTITECRVSEFGPVTFPAYADATAGLRSLVDEMVKGDFELILSLSKSNRFRSRLPSSTPVTSEETREETAPEEETAPSTEAPERTELPSSEKRQLPQRDRLPRSTRLSSAARPLRTSRTLEKPQWEL